MSNLLKLPTTTPTTLTLYTSISETEYEQLQTIGNLTCDEKNLHVCVNEDEETFRLPYQFMASKLRNKCPSKLIYPKWAYLTYNGQNKKFPKSVFRSGEKWFYLLKIQKPEKEVLLSDIDLYTICLNKDKICQNQKEADEFYNKVDKYELEIYNIFSAENDINPKALELRKEIIESWDWIFDINNTNDYMVYKNKTIQAVFWELRKEDVLCCKKYKNKGRV